MSKAKVTKEFDGKPDKFKNFFSDKPGEGD